MPRKTKDVAANLLRKGFRQRNSGDKYFHLYVGEKKTQVFTFVSHGEREIHDGLLAQMAKQTRLSKRRFLELVDCPLSQEKYVAQLREQGDLPPEEDGEAAGEAAGDE